MLLDDLQTVWAEVREAATTDEQLELRLEELEANLSEEEPTPDRHRCLSFRLR
jgi:hypothetical protein